MYHTINPVIQALSFVCILAGFFLPFFGYWLHDTFTLHSLAIMGFFVGMAFGYPAAILRDNAEG